MLQKSISLNGELPVSQYIEENQLPKIDNDYLLARIGFGDSPDSENRPANGPVLIQSGLKLLPGQPALEEIWLSKEKVSRGVENDIIWSADDNFLFAAHYIEESDQLNLEEATWICYRKLLSLVGKFDFPSLVRMWNYVPRINEIEDDLERYKSFTVGRFRAFEEAGIDDNDYSSACAVGSDGVKGVVYLLASRHSRVNFENPNQISAFKYPKEYGPRSPSFARATLATSPEANNYFISGTASIKKSETLHVGNIGKQLEVTFENIEKLIEVVDAYTKFASKTKPFILKTYVRKPEELELVKKAVNHHFGNDTQVIYVRGDICRKELLVEIDGICNM